MPLRLTGESITVSVGVELLPLVGFEFGFDLGVDCAIPHCNTWGIQSGVGICPLPHGAHGLTPVYFFRTTKEESSRRRGRTNPVTERRR
jgi:hypothetical protein